MEYYVKLYDVNKREFEDYNIFNNAYVYEDVQAFKKDWLLLKINRDDLIMLLDHTFHYAFWSKCEYEIMITDVFESRPCTKIDAFDQLHYNIPVIADALIQEWEEVGNKLI